MTSIVPANPPEGHFVATMPEDPAVWVRQKPGKKPGPALGPTLGWALGEFATAFPGKPLLIIAPGTMLRPRDAKALADIASRQSGAVVLTSLSNADARFNPFADVDTSRLQTYPGGGGEQAAALVNLLGSGNLHAIDDWPGHLLCFSPPAVALLAQADTDIANADARLRAGGGQLLLCDCVFAAEAESPLDLGPALQPHEEKQAAAWGDLALRLHSWLDSAAPLPDPGAEPEQSPTLHITHSWGGGVAQWVESFIAADPTGSHFQLRSEGPQSGHGAGQRLCLYAGNVLAVPIATWWLQPAIRSSINTHPQYREVLEDIQRRRGIGRVIVSSLVGHSLDALRTGVPTLEVLHDSYPAWPLLDSHPGPWLHLARERRLETALQSQSLLPDFRHRDAAAWNELADDWQATVASQSVHVVAPSAAAAAMLRQIDDRWNNIAVEIVPHGLKPFEPESSILPRPRADGKLRLVIPGRMQQAKGQALLLSALPELTRHAWVYLLGAGKHGEVFFGQSGVDVILQYRREELPDLLRTIGPDVAALLSVVPETFSYTLSEMQQLGIPVIATRVGSLPERIRDGQDGWLIDPDPAELVRLVERLAQERNSLEQVRTALRSLEHYPASAMVRRYGEICPPIRVTADLDHAPGLAEIQTAALAEDRARLEAERKALRKERKALRKEVEVRTAWAQERERALVDEQERRKRWVQSLETALREEQEQRVRWVQQLENALAQEQTAHRGNVEVLQAQYQAVLQSLSWRVTRPLRGARRALSNLAQARAWNPARWPLLMSQAVRILSTQGWRGAISRLQTSAHPVQAPPEAVADQSAPIGDPEPPGIMPHPERPVVSIVIPVFNQWPYTAACLRSIVSTHDAAEYEVIVVDDASGDESAERLKGIEGLTFIRNESNLGFIGSCNRGASAARGEYLVMLNNDTQVLDGWLDALLQTFRDFPDTGLAGARLVYPDGSLQEAGGIVFNDGSGWNYGRGDCAERPEYAFTREVDYCSGACVMLPSSLFQKLGGFDAHYAPAYYEDTDLAFKVRAAGLKVRVQAAATVIHHEGITSGTNLGSGVKRFQPVNRKKFLDRWVKELAAYPQPIADPNDGSAIRRARDHRLKGRVLIIDAYTPEPDQDSGSLRLKYLFECFQRLGYGVTFFADNRGYAGHYSAALQQAGVEVIYNPWIESLQDFFRGRGAEFAYVMISRHYVAANYISLIKRYCPQAKFIFDTVDLHYLREERLAELDQSLPLRRVAAQTRRSELAVIKAADATLVVSPVERTELQSAAPGAKVHVLSNIHRVVEGGPGFAARKDIFFVGGYQHPPNVDAAQWFVGSIWPLIRQQIPDLRFHLVGSKATDKVRALQGNGVEFHGFVKDLQPWLDGCRIAIAPLRYGAGVKGKVNLSMANGQPVLATPMAVEGLHARDGEDVLVAETASDFAAAVVRLYRDEALWQRLSAGGRENVRRHFSVDAAQVSLKSLLEELRPDV